MNKALLILFLLCTILHTPFSQTIYVSPEGNDSDSGSAEAPFATLQAALEQAGKKNGNTGSINQLFINDQLAIRARTPNYGNFYKTGKVEETIFEKEENTFGVLGIQKIKLSSEQFNTINGVADLHGSIIRVNHAWDQTRKFIDGLAATDSSLYIIGKPMQPWNKMDNSSQFFFENAPEFLDAPGEWFADNTGYLYYIPRHGETIENTTAIIPILEQLLIIQGTEQSKVENIHFENISFRHSVYRMKRRGDEPYQAAAFTNAAIYANHCNNINIENCEITQTGNNAIWFDTACSNCELKHSYLHHLGIGGVKIGSISIPEDETLLTHTNKPSKNTKQQTQQTNKS